MPYIIFVNPSVLSAAGMMGLNAFFAYSLVLGEGVTWQTALGVVFVSGAVFLVLTLAGLHRHVGRAIPEDLRLAIAAGIGVFIAFIGLQNLGLVVASDATLVKLGPMDETVLLGLATGNIEPPPTPSHSPASAR